MKAKIPTRAIDDLTMYEFVDNRYIGNLPALLDDVAAWMRAQELEDHEIWSLTVHSAAAGPYGDAIVWSAQVFVAEEHAVSTGGDRPQ